MSVLITGGAGFIGSHLAEELIKRGEKVYVIDDLSTGSISNIAHLENHPNFFYEIDTILNERLLERLIQRVDTVYHLAAAVGVKLIVDEPIQCITTNILGTISVLQLAYELGRKKVLITSTSEIYGKNTKGPFKEEDDRVLGPTMKVRWSYSTSKAVDEYLALSYYAKKKLPVTVVRLFNTVGPRQTGRYGMVLPRFVRQALLNQPITVYGDGNQRRCFTYVKDVIKALINLVGNSKSAGEIFNIGSNEEISIEELALKVKKITGSSSKIVKISYDKAYEKGFEDMQYRVPNTTKIKKLINFKADTVLEQIIKEVVKFFKSNPEALVKETE